MSRRSRQLLARYIRGAHTISGPPPPGWEIPQALIGTADQRVRGCESTSACTCNEDEDL